IAQLRPDAARGVLERIRTTLRSVRPRFWVLAALSASCAAGVLAAVMSLDGPSQAGVPHSSGQASEQPADPVADPPDPVADPPGGNGVHSRESPSREALEGE